MVQAKPRRKDSGDGMDAKVMCVVLLGAAGSSWQQSSK